jgi:hypothetical protein
MAYAQCPDAATGRYPGWQERFSGDVSAGGTATVENFDVTVEKIFDANAIRVNVLRDKSDYFRDSVSAGKAQALKKPDIIVELHNASATIANLSVYTPQKSNLTANLTNIGILNIEGDKINLLPGEVFQVDLLINNTGELAAKDLQITPFFGDFEIRDTDARDAMSLCPGSTQVLKYVLKTPDLREAFNYTLYIQFDYSDENIQTGGINRHSTFYQFNVEISPALLGISRSSSNWTLRNPGREVNVKVTMNNSGNEMAYNVQWAADLPPYVQVSEGTTSFSGGLTEGKTRTFNYAMVSDDPLICSGISRITYQDRYGNNYTTSSDNETFRFSPFVTIERTIGKYSEYFDPTKSVFQGDTIRQLTDKEWFERGGEDKSLSSGSNLTLNHVRNLSVSVKIKNMGNAVARGLRVNDSTNGSTLEGTTSWEGILHPGGEASYEYTMISFDRRETISTTNVSYLDVDPLSFKPQEEGIGGSPQVRFCTVTLKTVELGHEDTLYALVAELELNLSGAKVLSGSQFYFDFNLTSNGSDSTQDIITRVDTSTLESGARYGGAILEGQSVYYLPELRAKYLPDGTLRNWTPTNQSYRILLRAPEVDTKKEFDITVTANFTDFYGDVRTKNKSVNITVLPSIPAYEVSTIARKNLSVTSGSPGEIDLDGYGDAFIKLKNIGYANLDNITIKMKIPTGIELYTNDTAFHGRVVAELKRNDTWYGFEGEVAWNGSLLSGAETTLPFIIRGKKSGVYDINASLKFNSHNITGNIPVTVQGAILQITKAVNDPLISTDESTVVVVTVTNIGKSPARFVKVIDHVPDEFDIIGDFETDLDELKSGEQATMKYNLIPKEEGSFTLQRVDLEWTDELGNQYELRSNALAMEVVDAGEVTPEMPVDGERMELSRKQILATALFALTFLAIMFKFLTLKRPVREE